MAVGVAVSIRLGWMQRPEMRIWACPGLAPRWLGGRPWSRLVGSGNALKCFCICRKCRPLGSHWGRRRVRFGAVVKALHAPSLGTTLRGVARSHTAVVAPARRCIPVALAIDGVLGGPVVMPLSVESLPGGESCDLMSPNGLLI